MTGKVYIDNTPFYQFEKRVQIVENKLSSIFTNSYVRISCTTNINFVICYQACINLGLIPVISSNDTLSKDLSDNTLISCSINENEHGSLTFHITKKEPLLECKEIQVITRSSGTTGTPNYVGWHKQGINYQNSVTTNRMGYIQEDILLVTVPLWSSYGLSLIHLWQYLNCTLVLPSKIQPNDILTILKHVPISSIDAVPRWYAAWFKFVAKNPSLLKLQNSIKLWGCGGDILSNLMAQKWFDLIENPLLDGYGMTEAGPNISLNGPTQFKINTVGKPLPNTEVIIASDKEIMIKSPSIMFSNWDFKADEIAIPPSILATGDLGYLDNNGYLKIIGRKKNIVIINGVNICPEEIENTLYALPGVNLVIVFGFEINNKTRLIAGINKNDSVIKQAWLKSWCKERLKPEAIPNIFIPIKDIFYNENGKVDRKKMIVKLKEQLSFTNKNTCITSKETNSVN